MPGFTAGGHAGGQPAISGQIRGPDERARSGRGGGRSRGRPPAPASLFIVERRLPKASEHHLACSRRAALSGAALRFSARGDSVRYLYSILLARQQRLLSLFTAGGRPRRQCGGGPGPARRLDGIPLALQLAAVLPGSPSLDQLNQRLGLTTADERP